MMWKNIRITINVDIIKQKNLEVMGLAHCDGLSTIWQKKLIIIFLIYIIIFFLQNNHAISTSTSIILAIVDSIKFMI
jgi:hypothetical protein